MDKSSQALRLIRGGAPDTTELLEGLFRRYGGTVYGRCLALLQDPGAVDELGQIFASLLQDRVRIAAARSPVQEVLLVATRHCLGVVRRNPHRDPSRRPLGVVRTVQDFGRAELTDALRETLPAVEEETQLVAILFHLDELPLEEIALLLGASKAALERKLQSFNERVRRDRALLEAPPDRPLLLKDRGPACSAFLLRRAEVRELPEPEIKAARQHAASCAHCRGILFELDQEKSALSASIPMAPLVMHLARLEAPAAPRWIQAISVAVMAAGAFFMLGLVAGVLILQDHPQWRATSDDDFGLIAISEGHARPLDDGALLRPGETVSLGLRGAAHRYLTVISVDADGKVTRHLPASGRSPALGAWTAHPFRGEALAGAGRERFIGIFSDVPLDADEVVRKAGEAFQAAGTLPAMGRLELPGVQVSHHVEKDATRH